MTLKKINVLDLFCGAGGFSCGFEQAGFKVLAGIDNDDKALFTYKNNHKDSIAINHDLSSVNEDLFFSIDDAINGESIDVLIGGPPCQGFSVAGKRLEDDPRNKLWRAYIDVVERYKPRVIVLENVPTIVKSSKGLVTKAIIESFSEHGYITDVKVLLASDHGVPQKRKRAFFVATKKGMPFFQFPDKKLIESSYITTKQALSDLPLLSDSLGKEKSEYPKDCETDYQRFIRKNSNYLYNHSAVNHTEKTRHIISLVPDGGNYKDLPKELRETRRVNIAWTRMNSKKPCFTIDAGHNHHFHYEANRVPTVRECARIQSFPDNFIFYGTRTSQYRQVGNAVPPMIGYEIAKKVKEVFDE